MHIRKYNDLFDIKKDGTSFIILGNIFKNGKYFELINGKNRKDLSFGKQLLGVLFCEQEKWSHAMKQFTISIAINPKNNFVWFYLGFVCIKKNNFILAVRSFLRIIYEDPFNKNAWNNLSSIFSIFYEKKNECFITLKEIMKNKTFPFFILKKFMIYCFIPEKLKIKNVIEIFSKFCCKNIKKQFFKIIFLSKILITIEEIISKKFFNIKFLKLKKKMIVYFVNLNFLFLNFLFRSQISFVVQKGFLFLNIRKKIKFHKNNLFYNIKDKVLKLKKINHFK
jgi:tetratricopeptide (TPR) repeat protein